MTSLSIHRQSNHLYVYSTTENLLIEDNKHIHAISEIQHNKKTRLTFLSINTEFDFYRVPPILTKVEEVLHDSFISLKPV